jgi:hypothetical protein
MTDSAPIHLQPVRHVVTCEDGRSESFTTLWAARQWAEWGHFCTNRHDLTTIYKED